MKIYLFRLGGRQKRKFSNLLSADFVNFIAAFPRRD